MILLCFSYIISVIFTFVNLLRPYIFQIDNALKNLSCARRGNHRAVIRALRLVDDDQSKIFWRVRGKKADKRRNVFPCGDPAVFVFLRRTCISFYLCKLGNKNIENPL